MLIYRDRPEDLLILGFHDPFLSSCEHCQFLPNRACCIVWLEARAVRGCLQWILGTNTTRVLVTTPWTGSYPMPTTVTLLWRLPLTSTHSEEIRYEKEVGRNGYSLIYQGFSIFYKVSAPMAGVFLGLQRVSIIEWRESFLTLSGSYFLTGVSDWVPAQSSSLHSPFQEWKDWYGKGRFGPGQILIWGKYVETQASCLRSKTMWSGGVQRCQGVIESNWVAAVNQGFLSICNK